MLASLQYTHIVYREASAECSLSTSATGCRLCLSVCFSHLLSVSFDALTCVCVCARVAVWILRMNAWLCNNAIEPKHTHIFQLLLLLLPLSLSFFISCVYFYSCYCGVPLHILSWAACVCSLLGVLCARSFSFSYFTWVRNNAICYHKCCAIRLFALCYALPLAPSARSPRSHFLSPFMPPLNSIITAQK